MTDLTTLDAAVIRLQTVLLHADELPDIQRTIDARVDVLNRYGPIFAREHLPQISASEFYSFLLDENNRHWSGLYRRGSQAKADMEKLRTALEILLYGEEEMGPRFSKAVSMVTGMGRGIASALLLVVYPERYGVWNSTSEGGLKRLGLWPKFDRGASLGERYLAINEVLRSLARSLETDLWTLDVLWWKIDNPDSFGKSPRPSEVDNPDQAFGLERHLHDFLWDNWDRTSLAKDWERYTEEGNQEAGYEYPCDVGRIDLLANHRSDSRWLVIELKRGQTGDATIGQVLRYMGWVQQHVAQPGDTVEGLIIGREPEPGLRYALRMVPNVDYQRYEVQFSLHPVTRGGEAEA